MSLMFCIILLDTYSYKKKNVIKSGETFSLKFYQNNTLLFTLLFTKINA